MSAYDAMDEVESARSSDRDEETSVAHALARFLLSFDLPEEERLPFGAEPFVPEGLRDRLQEALDALTKEPGRTQVQHGRLRIAVESILRGGQQFVFAGVTREGNSRGPKVPSKTPAPAWMDGPPLTLSASNDNFQQHFRGLRGEFYSMRPRDLIQFFCSCATTVEVRFDTNLGERGEVLIEQGHVLHCATAECEGDEAARVMMLWESGNFLTRPLRESPPVTVGLPWMTLMLEHAREMDESGEFATVSAEIRPETLEALPGWLDAETDDDADSFL